MEILKYRKISGYLMTEFSEKRKEREPSNWNVLGLAKGNVARLEKSEKASRQGKKKEHVGERAVIGRRVLL